MILRNVICTHAYSLHYYDCFQSPSINAEQAGQDESWIYCSLFTSPRSGQVLCWCEFSFSFRRLLLFSQGIFTLFAFRDSYNGFIIHLKIIKKYSPFLIFLNFFALLYLRFLIHFLFNLKEVCHFRGHRGCQFLKLGFTSSFDISKKSLGPKK